MPPGPNEPSGFILTTLLVLVALFTVSVAGARVRNPFHTARVPTAADVQPIVAMLLTDTYLAFNLADEDAAFDQLARNLSGDLVPGVYLDSRRRLTAGTRQGAEVTVKDVSVLSVEAPIAVDSSCMGAAGPVEMSACSTASSAAVGMGMRAAGSPRMVY